MIQDSLLLSFLSTFAFFSFFITLIISKITNKEKSSFLLDQDYAKPQSFHFESVPRSGGLAGIILLSIFFIGCYFVYEKLFLVYFFLSFGLFSLGFLDDIKIKIRPNIRLLLMVLILLICIIFFSIEIVKVELSFLNLLLENKFFHICFVLLCFLFVINGSNLIDGFNGLLVFQLIIINFILLLINTTNGHSEISLIITGQIIVLFSFLLFNFPQSKIFMGDGGAYFYGGLVAFNTIVTNNLNPDISSFFFCTILFYLFFEVFFSFFRKLYFKKSPLKPDNSHLHMLVYKLFKKNNFLEKSNFLTSVSINLLYLVAIIPSYYLKEVGIFCKIWFAILICLYVIFYISLNNYLKKK